MTELNSFFSSRSWPSKSFGPVIPDPFSSQREESISPSILTKSSLAQDGKKAAYLAYHMAFKICVSATWKASARCEGHRPGMSPRSYLACRHDLYPIENPTKNVALTHVSEVWDGRIAEVEGTWSIESSSQPAVKAHPRRLLRLRRSRSGMSKASGSWRAQQGEYTYHTTMAASRFCPSCLTKASPATLFRLPRAVAAPPFLRPFSTSSPLSATLSEKEQKYKRKEKLAASKKKKKTSSHYDTPDLRDAIQFTLVDAMR